MRPHVISGYYFGDDQYCPACLYSLFVPIGDSGDPEQSTEELLDLISRQHGLNRNDRRTYTSDDFPYPLLLRDIDKDDTCSICQRVLHDVDAAP